MRPPLYLQARASSREFAEQWVQKARGGQQAWRPRGQEPRGALEAGGSRLRSERPRRARPRSLPALGDRCSRSLRRPLGRGGRRALVRNHYRNEFALLFTKQSFYQKRNKITTYHTLS